MISGGWERTSFPVSDADLMLNVRDTGEQVVLIQTALRADELLPLANQPLLGDKFRIVLYHRHGYGESSPVKCSGSIVRDAMDCNQLLVLLDIDRAHIVGLSYSGAVAMQLASASRTACTPCA